MKTRTGVSIWLATAVVAGAALAACAEEKQAKAGKREASSASGSSSSSSAGSGISVRTVNGQTTVTYKGEEVFSGQTSGMVSARSSSVNGAEYAAAFDRDKVLWENTSGAADQLKAAPTIDKPGLSLPGAEQQQPKKAKAAKKKRGDA